jgi:hypothetical protein
MLAIFRPSMVTLDFPDMSIPSLVKVDVLPSITGYPVPHGFASRCPPMNVIPDARTVKRYAVVEGNFHVEPPFKTNISPAFIE